MTGAGLLIGLTGAAGSGKDTVAAMLVRNGYRSIALADALRWEVSRAWVLDARVFSDRAGKEIPQAQLAVEWCRERGFLQWCIYQEYSLHDPRSPRWVLQQWGEWRRRADPLYWVHVMESWVQEQRSMRRRALVITDVRYANERAMVSWCGGYLVRVHRPGLGSLPADTAHHASEAHGELRADADIHNDGDLQHLEAEVARVVALLSDMQAVAAP